MNTKQKLEHCHALVWRTRSKLGDRWPTPNTSDCLAFALTECGEALDAMLRNNPTYRRNNEREMDEAAEWADVAIMLCTALGSEFNRWDDYLDQSCCSKAYIVRMVADAWDMLLTYPQGHRVQTVYAMQSLARLPDLDLCAEVKKKLQHIEAKHGGAAKAFAEMRAEWGDAFGSIESRDDLFG